MGPFHIYLDKKKIIKVFLLKLDMPKVLAEIFVKKYFGKKTFCKKLSITKSTFKNQNFLTKIFLSVGYFLRNMFKKALIIIF